MITEFVQAMVGPIWQWCERSYRALSRRHRPVFDDTGPDEPTTADDLAVDVRADEPDLVVEETTVENAEPAPLDPAPVARRRNRGPWEDGSARWNLRGLILDRLDEYFVCIRRMRRHDPDAYQLFSRTGFAIPSGFLNPDHPSCQVVTPTVAFGGCLLAHEDGLNIYPSFIYFQKLKRPARVQFFAGAVYSLTALFDDRRAASHWASRLVLPVRCHIGVSETGEMTLLREPTIRRKRFVTGRTKAHRRRETIELSNTEWKYPAWVTEIAADHDEDPQAWASFLLKLVFQTYRSSIEKIAIRTKSDTGDVAMFGLDVSRAKYFFSDRTVDALAADGKKKRIFHAVREHTRRVGDASSTIVKYHYRGIRNFAWNTYHVHIVWPEQRRVLEFDAAADDLANVKDPTKFMGMKQAATVFAELLDQ
jgi:hypothetical protein